MTLEQVDVLATADVGFSGLYPEAEDTRYFYQSCYVAANGFSLETQDVNTNTPTTTYCRAPASTQVS